jgi:peptidoglycan hydrolase CwlO-like protein
MTGQEKIKEITEQATEIKKNIQKKYDNVLKRISVLNEQLSSVTNAVNQSPTWIRKQQKKIQTKIDDLTKKLIDWLNQQTSKVQAWVDKIKNEILELIADLLKAPLLAMTGL